MTDREKLLELLMDYNEDVDFENEDALVEDGYLSSLDITVLITAIGDAFDIRIRFSDIGPENFNTLEGRLDMIREKRGDR